MCEGWEGLPRPLSDGPLLGPPEYGEEEEGVRVGFFSLPVPLSG